MCTTPAWVLRLFPRTTRIASFHHPSRRSVRLALHGFLAGDRTGRRLRPHPGASLPPRVSVSRRCRERRPRARSAWFGTARRALPSSGEEVSDLAVSGTDARSRLGSSPSRSIPSLSGKRSVTLSVARQSLRDDPMQRRLPERSGTNASTIGALRGTRTPMAVRPPPPEDGVSTNSTIRAQSQVLSHVEPGIKRAAFARLATCYDAPQTTWAECTRPDRR